MATRKSKVEPTVGASTYVDPEQIQWQPSQFEGIQIKVLYVDKEKGEMTEVGAGCDSSYAQASGNRAIVRS